MEREDASRYVYEFENVLDEFVIVLLSLGAISVTGWVLFASSFNYDIMEFGRVIEPWITMLALMIIGRELWLMNRRVSRYLDEAGE
ncbi:MAG: hypothetical protein ACLFTA_01080 [Candidatus Nanohaloarchaea archaeon]